MWLTGDMTVETVNTFLRENAVYTVNPLTGTAYSMGKMCIRDSNDAVAVDIGALKISDEYTFKHSVDVATMSMIVARKYGLDDKQVYEIGIAGLLHDIGKSKVPNEILNKAARLTDEEFAIMKQHSVYGYRILQSKDCLLYTSHRGRP